MIRLRKITAALLIASALGAGNAHAGDMMGDLNAMFLSNTTKAGGLSTADRAGFFGGSAYIRSPIQNINLIGFDPPRFSAGCGGVDLFGGSFSFINSQQITQIFRAVAANAVGLAFGAAIKTISPELYSLMQQFQSLLQSMNNLAKNSCGLAKLIIDPMEKAASGALNGGGSKGAEDNGLFSDAMSTLTGYLADAQSTLKKTAAFNPQQGNQVWKAAVATKTAGILGSFGISDGQDASTPNSLQNRLLVSMIGYQISSTPCSAANSAGTVNGGSTGTGKNDCGGPAIVTIDDLVRGGGGGSPHPEAPLSLYYCNNPNGEGNDTGGTDAQICTSIVKNEWNYPGIDAYVNTYLFGVVDATAVEPTSIIGLMNSGGSGGRKFTPEQRAFIQSSGTPLMSLLTSVSQAQDRIEMAKKLRAPIVVCITSEIAFAIAKSAVGITDNNSYQLSPESRQNIQDIKARALQYSDSCRDNNKVATIIDQIRNQTAIQSGR